MRQALCIPILCAPLGCGQPASSPSPLETGVVRQHAAPEAPVAPSVPSSQHSGIYWDAAGYGLLIYVNTDGSYHCEWQGCFGVYGTSDGSWHFDNGTFHFTPIAETEFMTSYLKALPIAYYSEGEWTVQRQNIALVPRPLLRNQ